MKFLILNLILWAHAFSETQASSKGPEIVIGSINGGFPASVQDNPLVHSNFEADVIDLLGTGRVPFVKDYNKEISRMLPLMYPKTIFSFQAFFSIFEKEYGKLERKDQAQAITSFIKEKTAINQALISYAKDPNDTNLSQLKTLYYLFYSAWQTTALECILDIVTDINHQVAKLKNKATFKVYPIAWHPSLLGFSEHPQGRDTLKQDLQNMTMLSFEPNEMEITYVERIIQNYKTLKVRIIDFNLLISEDLILAHLYRNKTRFSFNNLSAKEYQQLAQGLFKKNIALFKMIVEAMPETLILVNVGKGFPKGEKYLESENAWVSEAENVIVVANLQDPSARDSKGVTFLDSTNLNAHIAAPHYFEPKAKEKTLRYPGIAQLHILKELMEILQTNPSLKADKIKKSLFEKAKSIPQFREKIQEGRVLLTKGQHLLPSI